MNENIFIALIDKNGKECNDSNYKRQEIIFRYKSDFINNRYCLVLFNSNRIIFPRITNIFGYKIKSINIINSENIILYSTPLDEIIKLSQGSVIDFPQNYITLNLENLKENK